MEWLLLALLFVASQSHVAPSDPLVSRVLPIDLLVEAPLPLENFDLRDIREEETQPSVASELPAHSIFAIRRHVGIAGGYDGGVLHGSLGLYVTVAEWGRWNFGATSPEVGFGRYHFFDPKHRLSVTKAEPTILVSLVSVHYRGGYLKAIRKNWYLNVEQVFDVRANLGGSQIGFSFSNP